MKECLDAIRTLQTGVLLLSATLLALSLTPNLAPRYVAATAVLRELPALPRDAATVAVRARNQQEYQRLQAAIDSISVHPAPGVTMKPWSTLGLHVSFPSYSGDPSFDFQPAPVTESLADEQRFYRGVLRRIQLLPDSDAFAAYIRQRLPAWRPVTGVVSLDLMSEGEFNITWRVRDRVDSTKTSTIRFQTADSAQKGVPVIANPDDSTKVWALRPGSSFGASERLNEELLSTVFSDWSASGRGYFGYLNVNRAAMRKIPPLAFIEDTLRGNDRAGGVWNEIRDMSRTDAIRYTEERGRASSASLSLFGLSVNEQLASIGGPLVLWLALGYLLIHLQHLKRIAGTDEALLQRYPWPPLFPGVAGATASAVLLVIIPLSALVRFALRVRDTVGASQGSESRYQLVQVLAGAAVLTGVVAHVAARRIRVAPIVNAQHDVAQVELAPSAVGRRWSQAFDGFFVTLRGRWGVHSLDARTLTPDDVAPLRTEMSYALGAWAVAWVVAVAGNVAVFALFASPGLRNWVIPIRTLSSNTTFNVWLAAIFSSGGIFALAGASAAVYRWFGSRVPFGRQAATQFQVMSLEPLVWCIAAAMAAASFDSHPYVVGLAIVSRCWYVVVAWTRMLTLHPLARNRVSSFAVGFLIPFILVQALFVYVIGVGFFLAANIGG